MAEPEPIRVIKRYANRKLYDTRDSKYVTLDRIAELVRSGEEVKVVDNRTKRDLTKVTLAQIIYEEQRSGNATAWSVQSLRGFIQQGREKILSSLKEGRQARRARRGARRRGVQRRRRSRSHGPRERVRAREATAGRGAEAPGSDRGAGSQAPARLLKRRLP
ncbi:MAG: hypothetical protein EP303_02095 [Deltaproteobacteria bacterium]|nr:MAG: hypothetical protein EP303_02095 [Deltaproteobacteria bacterium]